MPRRRRRTRRRSPPPSSGALRLARIVAPRGVLVADRVGRDLGWSASARLYVDEVMTAYQGASSTMPTAAKAKPNPKPKPSRRARRAAASVRPAAPASPTAAGWHSAPAPASTPAAWFPLLPRVPRRSATVAFTGSRMVTWLPDRFGRRVAEARRRRRRRAQAARPAPLGLQDPHHEGVVGQGRPHADDPGPRPRSATRRSSFFDEFLVRSEPRPRLIAAGGGRSATVAVAAARRQSLHRPTQSGPVGVGRTIRACRPGSERADERRGLDASSRADRSGRPLATGCQYNHTPPSSLYPGPPLRRRVSTICHRPGLRRTDRLKFVCDVERDGTRYILFSALLDARAAEAGNRSPSS